MISPETQTEDAAVNDTSSEAQSQFVDRLIELVERRLETERRPTATYRVQFHSEFKFQSATDQIPYWKSLGISDVYASPYLKAVPGSKHGYDIVDHSTLNPDVGNTDDYRRFTDALDANGMGHILDWVPNHMGVSCDDNPWWQDVLENGPGSKHSSYFDIDWNPPKTDLQGKVLLPVLGEQFGKVLESGQLKLEFQNGAFLVRYYSRRFPISPPTYQQILQYKLDELSTILPNDDPNALEFHSILTAVSHLPAVSEMDPTSLEVRYREQEIIKRRLQRVCEECPPLRDRIYQIVEAFNGKVGDPASFDLLDKLLAEQSYRLSFWRVAADEINYRRFFDVNELAAVCMERPEVFEDAHAFVFRLLDEGLVDGLRIDHADGLYDPTAYLWKLQERRFLQICHAEFNKVTTSTTEASSHEQAAVEGEPHFEWAEIEAKLKQQFTSLRETDKNSIVLKPLYLVVEKILERNESLPQNWPIHGSTGYDFVNDVNGVFVDGKNARKFEAIYSKFAEIRTEFEELVYEAKRLILRASMSSELHVLGHSLDRISERSRWTRDFTLHGLIQALREVIACFPVYRTYTVGCGILERDRRYVEQAIARAKRRNLHISSAIFDFLREILLLEKTESLSEEELNLREGFVGRFQQLTGPMMAKAVEDTTFYRYNRLVSLNEVGGDPQRFGVSVDEFHQLNQERVALRPFAMLATSTHDTKRSEDVRARINVLSEMPDEWKRRVSQWGRWNKRKKQKLEGELVPSRNDEYLLYQILVGTWPDETPHGDELKNYVSRIQQYMIKAVREAKLHSSWIAPDESYERETSAFVETVLCDSPMSAFRVDFEPWARQIADCGMWNSLSQTLLKLTSPGVPDIYQGTELWDFSLVDPDNRRAVDYERRSVELEKLHAHVGDSTTRPQFASDLLQSARDGRIKLFVHLIALELRRRHSGLLTTGAYVPVQVTGTHAAHVCAFVRQSDSASAIVVVPRLVAGLASPLGTAPIGDEVWGDTTLVLPADLASQSWSNLFTDEKLSVSANSSMLVREALQRFPVGLLYAETVRTDA